MYNSDTDASIRGGLASGVPGDVRGLGYLHETYGKLDWKDVVIPAATVARYGFSVTADIVRYMDEAVDTGYNFLVNEPTWAIDFAPNGTLVGLGDILTRKRYADTLETIANHGPDAFYTGAIANATIAALQKANGTMTLEDLKNYNVVIREPASVDYGGYKIHACSAPAGGTVVLAALKIFESYGSGSQAKINLTTHYLDESLRFAYGERTSLGDPALLPNMTQYERVMLSEKTATEIRAKISDKTTFNISYYNPTGLESLETVRSYIPHPNTHHNHPLIAPQSTNAHRLELPTL
jgi:gamma-glutamyltranspeptidase/glutathione hydrolase